MTTWTRTAAPGIYRDEDDGRHYRVVVNLGHAGGARRRVVRVLHDASYAQAQRQRTALLADRDAGKRRPTTRQFVTVRDWLLYYLEAYKKPVVEPTTFERYQGMMARVLAVVGDKRLDRLAPDDVQECYNALAHLAPSTRVQTGALFRAAMRQAERSEHIRRNPAAAVANPRGARRRRPQLLTIDQVRTLLAAMEVGQCGAYHIVRFGLETGLREGEAMALEWAALDLERAVVHVRRTVATIPNPAGPGRVRIFRERAKTVASEGDVYLAPSTVAWLRAHRKQLVQTRLALGPRWWTDRDGDLVFPMRRPFAGNLAGRCWDASSLRKSLRRYTGKLGLPDMNFHDCRRLYISAAAQRMPLVTVRDLARHADLDVTANVYAQSSVEERRAGALAMDGLWVTWG